MEVKEEKVNDLLQALQVELHVEIGFVRLSAQEILELYQGKFLSVDFDPNQIVSLLLNRHEIARAKLCATNDGLMLEIVQIIDQ